MTLTDGNDALGSFPLGGLISWLLSLSLSSLALYSYGESGLSDVQIIMMMMLLVIDTLCERKGKMYSLSITFIFIRKKEKIKVENERMVRKYKRRLVP